MANAKIFRINYKSDFILTLESDAGWMTPFCVKFWTGAPSQAYYIGWDGETYNHCSFDPSEPTKLQVQFDDHHLPVGDLKYQVAYHFTMANFPNDTEDEVINPANVTTEIDGETYQVMLDFTGETAPEIQFSLPAYANEVQRIANEQQRIANEQERIEKEQQRIADEETRQAHEAQRIAQETARVNEFATLKSQSQAATRDANDAATLANQKAQLAQDKANLAQAAATLANQKAQLAADKAALANAAAQLANEKAALAQQKAEYAQQQGGYAKDQGDYAKNQGDYAKEQGDTALADHQRAEADHGIAVDDHTQAGNDHTRAESDHGTAADDHTQAGNDHTRAESDHGIAVDDHTQAGNDHTRAESDHGIAADDHTQAGNDHTRAESDHTRAESDHDAVEVYVDSLGVFDLSKHNAVGVVLATYADLSAALTALNALESKYKYGGMSFKFVHSVDNKYVQYRLMSATFSTIEGDWQSENADDEPIAGSKNLVESGGVYSQIEPLVKKTSNTSLSLITSQSESIQVTDNNETEVLLEITENGVSGKNIKSNGKDVLTDHQDLTYLEEDIDELQTEIDNLQFEEVPTQEEESFIVFEDEDNEEVVGSFSNKGLSVKLVSDMNGNFYFGKTIYISPNGNDSNIGTREYPKLNINNAIASGATTIILLGGVYNQTIDFTAGANNIAIKGENNARVIFKKSDSLISDSGNESLVDSYTKVYKLENVSNIDYGTNRPSNWLFFDGMDDVNTIISQSDIHPCQRGKFYRNDCTKIWHTDASTLSEALAEIESTQLNEYKWFYDSTTQTLYFNRNNSTSVYPIYKSTGSYITTSTNDNRSRSILISNIEFRYGSVSFYRVDNCKIVDCAVKYVYSEGAFSFTQCSQMEFIRCEAACAFHGATGDGFNSHASTTGDIFSKINTAKLVDCWSHDNNDDGWSSHEYSEVEIYGGLYEWNGKAGITPSFGCHCLCYNVYSRHNYSGFYYAGQSNDNGNGGQIFCYNCISEQNDRGGSQTGFNVSENNNKMSLFNCIAINEVTGYTNSANTQMDLCNCKASGCTTDTSFNGSYTINNGTLINN